MVKSLLRQVLSLVFPLISFPNGTMAGAALCMAVISFYGVAMSRVFSPPRPSLCSACRFITQPCSGQLVCKPTSHPTRRCHHPAISLQSPAQRERERAFQLPLLCTHSRNKNQLVSQRPPFCLVAALSLDWRSLMVFQMADAETGHCMLLRRTIAGSFTFLSVEITAAEAPLT